MGLSTKAAGGPCLLGSALYSGQGARALTLRTGSARVGVRVSSSAEMRPVADSKKSFLVSFASFHPLQIRVRTLF